MSSPVRDAGITAATSSSPARTEFSSWQACANFLQEQWGKPDTSSELGAVAESIIAAEPTPGGRIARALAFVRREIRGMEGPLRLDQAPQPPREVLRLTAGGAVDRAALLWHLLRRIGMPARPVFVGTAASVGDCPPSLGAFDRVLVEVAGRCHSVDAPDAERDRALADTPLGLTLAPGIVDLEPIAPWQPAPAETAQDVPKPPPMALRPATAAPKPVQVEFVMDFASMVTARAAEVEAALFSSAPPPPAPRKPEPAREPSAAAPSTGQILVPRLAATAPEPEPVKPAEISNEAVVISPEPDPEVDAPARSASPPVPPKPAFSEEATVRAFIAPEIPVAHAPTPATEPEPAAPVEELEVPAPATPEPVPEMAAPAPAPPPEPAPVDPIVESVAEAVVPVPPAAEDITLPPSPTPAPQEPTPSVPRSAVEKPTPREPLHRRSLREDLEQRAKSHRQTVRDPRPNPLPRPSMREQPAPEPTPEHSAPKYAAPEYSEPKRTEPEQPAPKRVTPNRPPMRANDDSERWEYSFDPTHRARRTGVGGQLKLALMVIGFLAVIALWIFVFMAKRGTQ